MFVIPDDDGKKWERGRAFGELLNHGSAAQLAPLGLCEVVCATMAEVRGLLPSAGAGEPLMVLIDSAQVPARVQRIDPMLPDYPNEQRFDADWATRVKREDAISDQRIAVLARHLTAAVAPDSSSLAGREAALAGEVRDRLVKQRVPGSHWANASGCGTRVEEDKDEVGIACGMGHVPSKSSRFLYLYAQTPGEQYRAQREARDKARGK